MNGPNHPNIQQPTAWNTPLDGYLSVHPVQNYTTSEPSSNTTSTFPRYGHNGCAEALRSVSSLSLCACGRQDDQHGHFSMTETFPPSDPTLLLHVGGSFRNQQVPYPTTLRTLEPRAESNRAQPDKNTKHRVVTCETCRNPFKNKSSLRKHVHTIHVEKRKVFRCTRVACAVTFTLEKDLRRHMDTVHNRKKQRNPKCEFCGTEFSRKDNLDRHVKKSHPDKVPVADMGG